MSESDYKEAFLVLQKVKSVCGTCNGKGLTTESSNIGVAVCKCCDGKGYHTYEELLKQIEEEK